MMAVSGAAETRRSSHAGRRTGPASRTPVALALIAAAGAWLAGAAPALAGAASTPDSARIAAVRIELLRDSDVQIVTEGAKILARDPAVGPDGLWLRGIAHHWGITAPATPPQPRLVPWAEIESIRVRKGPIGSGVVVGTIVGLTIGMAIAFGDAMGGAFGGSEHHDTEIVLAIAGGPVLGWLIDRPGRWRPIYP